MIKNLEENLKTESETALQKCSLIWEHKRLETFKSWPFGEDKPCSAAKLSEAGFYYTGSNQEPDAVQCFYCDKALDGWDENDDPWSEHLSHSATCKFAKLGQPQEALTFNQLSNFYLELIKKELEKSMKNSQTQNDKLFNTRFAKVKRGFK